MIKEIIEKELSLLVSHTFNETYILCELGKGYFGIGKSFDTSLEQACRQYVKENGFKVKWFDKIVDTSEILYDIRKFRLDSYGDENINKLIAWLYANDIEIKE